MLQIKRTRDTAILPTRGSPGAAGYDLYSTDHVVILGGQRARISTGLIVVLPPGTYGRIAPRSGIAFSHGIDVLAGVVDADYQGEVNVILHNTGHVDFTVMRGDRIAQLILEKIVTPDVIEIDTLPGETVRGASGFGSTGV